jgi:hypothetical protein
MEKIVDAQMIEKELEKINSFLGCRKKVNESRVQKRTFSKRGLFSLFSLDMISGFANHRNETEGKHPDVNSVKQFLYYAMDLYMSSLTDKSKMSFMEYLTRTESDDDFEELSHIRGYFLNEFDENGVPENI